MNTLTGKSDIKLITDDHYKTKKESSSKKIKKILKNAEKKPICNKLSVQELETMFMRVIN